MSVAALRFPLFAKWYITGKCNLRCSHCYLRDYVLEPRLEFVLSVIGYLSRKNLLHISFLGGEPLTRGDIVEIIGACTGSGIGVKLATNGTLLNASLVRRLRAAGLRDVQISFEGHSPELSDPIRGRGVFDRAFSGIRLLKRHDMRVSISLTLSHENVSELERIFEFAQASGAQRLKLGAFVPIGTGLYESDRFLLRASDIDLIKRAIPQLQLSFPDIALESAFISMSGKGSSSCSTFGCGAGTHSIVINNDLSVSACDILTEEDRTSERITHPEDIEDLWLHHDLFKKWRGESCGSTRSIGSFKGVHSHACQVAYSAYGQNIFSD